MSRDLDIQAKWDSDANVWVATCADVPGLVVEGGTWPSMIEEVKLVLPDLLELSGEAGNESLSLTFKAETHLDLAGV